MKSRGGVGHPVPQGFEGGRQRVLTPWLRGLKEADEGSNPVAQGFEGGRQRVLTPWLRGLKEADRGF